MALTLFKVLYHSDDISIKFCEIIEWGLSILTNFKILNQQIPVLSIIFLFYNIKRLCLDTRWALSNVIEKQEY